MSDTDLRATIEKAAQHFTLLARLAAAPYVIANGKRAKKWQVIVMEAELGAQEMRTALATADPAKQEDSTR